MGRGFCTYEAKTGQMCKFQHPQATLDRGIWKCAVMCETPAPPAPMCTSQPWDDEELVKFVQDYLYFVDWKAEGTAAGADVLERLMGEVYAARYWGTTEEQNELIYKMVVRSMERFEQKQWADWTASRIALAQETAAQLP